ncbi:hypothetical protein P886_3180 [Alteromonadaceae bacterium 2753L.S.0a.02]|nr:hypothetical protein P886_3180 [Alteromonadaceae bacterium 2753L.S.0a.02]
MDSNNLTLVLVLIVLAAALIATPLSCLLLVSRYRKKHLLAMHTISGGAQNEVTNIHRQIEPTASLSINIEAADKLVATKKATVYQRISSVLLISGVVYSLLTTLPPLFYFGEFSPYRMLFLMVVYLWPTVIIAAALGLRMKYPLSVYFIVFLAVCFLVIAVSRQINLLQLLFFWVYSDFLLSLVSAMLLASRWRAIFPLVFAFWVTALTGTALADYWVVNNDTRLATAADIMLALGLGSWGAIITWLGISLLVFGFLGALLLRTIGVYYRKGAFNDISLNVAALWLIFAVFHNFNYAFQSVFGLLWAILCFAITFACYKIFATHTVSAKGQALVWLRVFEMGNRGQALFGSFSVNWRRRGPIYMISGPDMNLSLITPPEFMRFVSLNLGSLYIKDDQSLRKRLEMIQNPGAVDGFYPIEELFCHANTWQASVTALMENTKRAIMDLRGFQAKNTGCRFEVCEVLRRIPLKNLLFLIDDHTDSEYLTATIKEQWQLVGGSGVNANERTPELRVLHVPDKALKYNELEKLANLAA